MRKHFEDSIEIPEGVSCDINGKILNCTNNENSLALQLPIPKIRALIKEGRITLSVQKGNKNHWKLIKSYISHIKNLFPFCTDRVILPSLIRALIFGIGS